MECYKVKKFLGSSDFLKLIFGVFFFIIATIFQIRETVNQSVFPGVISQLQVMISVFMTVSVIKKGFITAFVLNLILLIMITVEFSSGNVLVLPGIIIAICTIITISIIYWYELIHIKQKEQLKKYNQELKEKKIQLEDLSSHDYLTKLPNRKMIINELDSLCGSNCQKENVFAVVFIDIDKFKSINDNFGHQAGDNILFEMGKKLMEIKNKDDLVGRIGGDEFILISKSKHTKEELYAYLEKIKNRLMELFDKVNIEKNIDFSFGIALFPKDGETSNDLLRRSDMAMYRAKKDSENKIFFI